MASGVRDKRGGSPDLPSLCRSRRRVSEFDLDTAQGERPERIAKLLARAGVCSRRDAERWIVEGRVSVDGHVLTTPAVTGTAASDIRVDGKPLPAPERPRLWRYHKPAGAGPTHRRRQGGATGLHPP